MFVLFSRIPNSILAVSNGTNKIADPLALSWKRRTAAKHIRVKSFPFWHQTEGLLYLFLFSIVVCDSNSNLDWLTGKSIQSHSCIDIFIAVYLVGFGM